MRKESLNYTPKLYSDYSWFSALEMVTKLCDSEFFRKAKAADVFAKVYNLFMNAGVGRGDKV